MQRIEVTNLKGINCYFTNFDNRIVSETIDKDNLKRRCERTLKVLLLTKNNVVCAASHLTNEISYEILSKNPIILEKEMLIPAFRIDKTDISELFENKHISQDKKDRYTDFYKENLKKVLSWELRDNANWFQEKFIHSLSLDKSVIRTNLSLKNEEVGAFIQKLKQQEILSREVINRLTSNFDNDDKRNINAFRELVYHMSGARVTNCESSIPQENYIDYSLTNIETRKTCLSDLQIFWKMYIELLFEKLNKSTLSIEVLDSLSFEDIYHIREPIQKSKFIEKYHQLHKIAQSSVVHANNQDILFNSDEISSIAQELAKGFDEIHTQFKESFIHDNRKSLVKAGMRIAGGIISSILPTEFTTTVQVLEETRNLKYNILNSCECIFSKEENNHYNNYYKKKIEGLCKIIDSSDIREKFWLSDFYKLMMDTLSYKIRM